MEHDARGSRPAHSSVPTKHTAPRGTSIRSVGVVGRSCQVPREIGRRQAPTVGRPSSAPTSQDAFLMLSVAGRRDGTLDARPESPGRWMDGARMSVVKSTA